MNKTALVMNGLTLDKAVFSDILKNVANDRHINYAINLIKNHYKEHRKIFCAKSLSTVLEVISWVPGVNVLSQLKFLCDISIEKIGNKIPLYSDKIDPKTKTNFDYWNIFFRIYQTHRL